MLLDEKSIERQVRTGLLYDFYGGLLTEKQRRTMELYYQEDWSLAEIAEAEGVSRQAVYDLLQRSEKLIDEYETKLGLMKRFLEQQSILNLIAQKIDHILIAIPEDDNFHQTLSEIRQQISCLLESETTD